MLLFQKTPLPDQSGLLSLLHIHARPRWASCQNTQWTQGRRVLRAVKGGTHNNKRSQYLKLYCAWGRMYYHPTIMLSFCHIQPKYFWIWCISMMVIEKKRHYFANKGPSSQSYGFSSGYVWMWELDCEEGWAPKNWCFSTVVLENSWESLGLQGDPTSPFWRRSALGFLWKEWC